MARARYISTYIGKSSSLSIYKELSHATLTYGTERPERTLVSDKLHIAEFAIEFPGYRGDDLVWLQNSLVDNLGLQFMEEQFTNAVTVSQLNAANLKINDTHY